MTLTLKYREKFLALFETYGEALKKPKFAEKLRPVLSMMAKRHVLAARQVLSQGECDKVAELSKKLDEYVKAGKGPGGTHPAGLREKLRRSVKMHQRIPLKVQTKFPRVPPNSRHFFLRVRAPRMLL